MPIASRLHRPLWWTAILALWLVSTWIDRSWLSADQRLPSWDQAEYLSSAIEHGRGLGLLEQGRWLGWAALLDLSPKIPPLSSLISGAVIAVAGDGPDQASWVLSLWHGVLLITVACWGRQLKGPSLGLLAALVVAIAPAMAEHRVEFSLDLPLAASTTLALWLLYRWQSQDPLGGGWHQAVMAAGAIASSLLIKQSALLIVALPALWSGLQALREPRRRQQFFVGLVLVLLALTPWLHHNWISTLGGTERAVLTSGAEEGDPGWNDLASLIWYPRLWPSQLGELLIAGGIAGALLSGWRERRELISVLRQPVRRLPSGWAWLIGVALSGWLCTSLSPNKDARYIAPVLPLLALLIAQGWLLLIERMPPHWSHPQKWLLTSACFGAAAALSLQERWQAVSHQPGSPAMAVIEAIRKQAGDKPTTVLLTASESTLNEQTLSYLGQLNGGQIQARRLGRSPGHESLALDQGRWWVLATGNQGTSRQSARALSRQVRLDSRFERVQSWPWSDGRRIELWQRSKSAPQPARLDVQFIEHARQMERGPSGLAPIFNKLGTWHLLDPQFDYQERVRNWATKQLEDKPSDRNALWSLALLATINNRLDQAEKHFTSLESLEGQGSWASAYRSVVSIANWKTCQAATHADESLNLASDKDQKLVLQALRDLARATCFDLRGAADLSSSLKPAVQAIEKQIKKP